MDMTVSVSRQRCLQKGVFFSFLNDVCEGEVNFCLALLACAHCPEQPEYLSEYLLL